jgi:hypothetical protein
MSLISYHAGCAVRRARQAPLVGLKCMADDKVSKGFNVMELTGAFLPQGSSHDKRPSMLDQDEVFASRKHSLAYCEIVDAPWPSSTSVGLSDFFHTR